VQGVRWWRDSIHRSTPPSLSAAATGSATSAVVVEVGGGSTSWGAQKHRTMDGVAGDGIDDSVAARWRCVQAGPHRTSISHRARGR
jgi:hypothetical protein